MEDTKTQLKQAKSDLNMAQDLIAKNHDKALKFDHTQNQLETQNLKVAEQENQLKITQSQLENITLKYREIQISHETIKQRESLLEEDKCYLKRQNDELSTRKNELEKINNDLMDRNLRLQSAREDLGTSLYSSKIFFKSLVKFKTNNFKLFQLKNT